MNLAAFCSCPGDLPEADLKGSEIHFLVKRFQDTIILTMSHDYQQLLLQVYSDKELKETQNIQFGE